MDNNSTTLPASLRLASSQRFATVKQKLMDKSIAKALPAPKLVIVPLKLMKKLSASCSVLLDPSGFAAGLRTNSERRLLASAVVNARHYLMGPSEQQPSIVSWWLGGHWSVLWHVCLLFAPKDIIIRDLDFLSVSLCAFKLLQYLNKSCLPNTHHKKRNHYSGTSMMYEKQCAFCWEQVGVDHLVLEGAWRLYSFLLACWKASAVTQPFELCWLFDIWLQCGGEFKS